MKRIALLLVSLVACTSSPSPQLFDAPKPAYMGMPAASGRHVAATYGHSYLVMVGRWRTRLVGLRDVAPTFHGNEVMAATDTGVAAFRLKDGALLWHRDLGDRASTPMVADGHVVATTWSGRVVMLERWSFDLPGPSLGPPAATGGLVVASWEGGVVGIDAATGSERWHREFEGADTSAPAILGGLAVVVGGDRRVHALDLTTGNERWSVATKGAGSPEAPPAASRDRIAAVDRLGHLTVINGDGAVLWSADGRGAVVRGGPVWVGEAVAVALDDGRVMVATRHDTRFHDPPGRVSGLAAAGNNVIVATREAATNGLRALRVGAR